MTARELHWKTSGPDAVVRIDEAKGKGVLHRGDRHIAFNLLERDADGGWLEIEGRRHRYYLHRNREQYSVWVDGRTYLLTRQVKTRSAESAGSTNSAGEVRSLMPGKVLRVDVQAGDPVTERQTVVIMESMKMETSLVAPRAGTVSEVRCKPGQAVEMGEVLVVISG